MKPEAAIIVERVNKVFKLPHERYSSLKQNVIHLFDQKKYSRFEAVKNVSFEVKKGEFFGIVGRNGSGKSTLLKMLAGIYIPSSGSIKINGRLSPFIELGVGFNPELSARDNIYLNGAILGLTKKQIEDKFEEVIAFAELEEFVDQKLKNYSSGMQVRLAFSIAIQAQSEILLIDEVLAVGDANFQAKCFKTFKSLKAEGKTIVFVSHDMEQIKAFCERAILINKGRVVAAGSTERVINEYNRLNLLDVERENAKAVKTPYGKSEERWGDGSAVIIETKTLKAGKPASVFESKQPIEVGIRVKADKKIENPVVGLVIKSFEGTRVFVTNTDVTQTKTPVMSKGQILEIICKINNVFGNGHYTISPAIASKDTRTFYDWVEDMHEFEVRGVRINDGLVHPEHTIKARTVV